MSLASLFEPIRVKGLTIPNRCVMAPMTRCFATGGVIPSESIAYYRRRAEGGVGLILTEVVTVERPAAHGDPNMPRWGGRSAEAWRQVVRAVHEAGGLIALQIGHGGANANPVNGWLPDGELDSPSGLDNHGNPLGQPMTPRTIEITIGAFAKAAAEAKAVGFDAVEVHGAHGGLIDMFAWSHTNRRTDDWGGPMRNRARFGAEVVRAIRAATGPDFPIFFRMSQWKIADYTARVAQDPAELAEWIEPLAEAGVDVFHGSQRRFWEPEFAGHGLNFAGWLKKLSGKPAITVGSVGLSGEFLAAYAGEASTPTPLDALLSRLGGGEFDLVAVGRALLGDPEWLRKMRQGATEELKAFDPAMLATLA